MKCKRFWVILTAILFCLLIPVGHFIWHTEYAETTIMTSENGEFRIVIFMVGEADWPFGATHCRAVLYHGTKQLHTCNFSVYNDGGNVNSDNFSVSWDETGALVTAIGDEQGAQQYILPFCGS